MSVIWLSTRVTMLTLSLLWPRDRQAWVDLDVYATWARDTFAGASAPFDLNEYPPLAQAALLALGWTTSKVLYAAMFVACMAALDFLILQLLKRRAIESGLNAGVKLWLFAPALLGPVLWTRFDLLPAALAIWALTSTGQRRAGVLGLAMAVKLWPIALVPALLSSNGKPTKQLRTFLVVMTAGVVLPGVLLGTGLLGSIRWLIERGLQIESLPGSLVAAAGLMGVPAHSHYAHGSWEVRSALAGPATYAWTSIGFLLLCWILWRSYNYWRRVGCGGEAHQWLLIGQVCVVAMICAGKVLSPQYLVWLLATNALSLSTVKSKWARATTVGLVAASSLSHIVYPLVYVRLLALDPFPVILLLLRNALLVAILFVTAREMIAAMRRSTSKDGPRSSTPSALDSSMSQP